MKLAIGSMSASPKPSLTAPFKNESKDPRGFTYVPVEDVIERLNLVLGTGQWSYECETAHVDDRGIVVKGRLSACGGVYEQYGGQNYNRFGKDHKSSPGEVMDTGNDFKGAASDALKKCAQQIGVALYIPLGHSPRVSETTEVAPSPSESGDRSPHQPVPAPIATSDTTAGGGVPASTDDPSPRVPPQVAEAAPPKREEVRSLEETSAGKRDNHEGAAGGQGKKQTTAPPVDPLPEPDPEIQKLIGRFNNLPLEAKAQAMALKRKLKIQNWFTAKPDAIAEVRALVEELEPVG